MSCLQRPGLILSWLGLGTITTCVPLRLLIQTPGVIIDIEDFGKRGQANNENSHQNSWKTQNAQIFRDETRCSGEVI